MTLLFAHGDESAGSVSWWYVPLILLIAVLLMWAVVNVLSRTKQKPETKTKASTKAKQEKTDE